MSMRRIREVYGVPAKRGMRVVCDGTPGVIVGASRTNMHLLLRLDDDPRHTVPAHPTWRMEYTQPELPFEWPIWSKSAQEQREEDFHGEAQ